MNYLIAAYVLLWQQGKVLGSIYFTRHKVVDFPKSGYIYCLQVVVILYIGVTKVAYIISS